MKVVVLALALFAVPGLTSTDNPPEMGIEFDKSAGTNPSSPEKGVLEATGTITVPKGYTFKEITINYRLAGTQVWTVEKVPTPSKDAPGKWSVKLSKIPAGKYEVQAILSTLKETKRDPDRAAETPDVRTVTIE